MSVVDIISSSLTNDINLFFVVMILFLALVDVLSKKDLKGQIVSLGVLGTFVGIFVGLQSFDPSDIKNSISYILEGLKTAFFTSIVGMGVSTVLSIIQNLTNKLDNEGNEVVIFQEISSKLNGLDKIVNEVNLLREAQVATHDDTKGILTNIVTLKDNSHQENELLIQILEKNFEKVNQSLEVAIESLAEGVTEEIINALKVVIEEFNQELQDQFGDNFKELNQAVVKLLEWQNNYKTHIETIDEHLQVSTQSIDKSRDALAEIASRNTEVMDVYHSLEKIINTYSLQTEELNRHLKEYAELSGEAKSMFSSVQESLVKTEGTFKNLANYIGKSSELQKKAVESSMNNIEINIKTKTEEVRESISLLGDDMASTFNATARKTELVYKDLAGVISANSERQKEIISNSMSTIESDIKIKSSDVRDHINHITDGLSENKKAHDQVASNIKELSVDIPKAMEKSLDGLNSGLTSLTRSFQKEYEDLLDKQKSRLQ